MLGRMELLVGIVFFYLRGGYTSILAAETEVEVDEAVWYVAVVARDRLRAPGGSVNAVTDLCVGVIRMWVGKAPVKFQTQFAEDLPAEHVPHSHAKAPL